MSQGLKKLALIQKVFEKLAEWNAYDLARLDKDYETNFDLDFLEIEKELKALEIIKNKVVLIDVLVDSENANDYNEFVSKSKDRHLTQEDYDLLKKVLL